MLLLATKKSDDDKKQKPTPRSFEACELSMCRALLHCWAKQDIEIWNKGKRDWFRHSLFSGNIWRPLLLLISTAFFSHWYIDVFYLAINTCLVVLSGAICFELSASQSRGLFFLLVPIQPHFCKLTFLLALLFLSVHFPRAVFRSFSTRSRDITMAYVDKAMGKM